LNNDIFFMVINNRMAFCVKVNQKYELGTAV